MNVIIPAPFIEQKPGYPIRYGQVEPNHLSGLSTATILGNIPAFDIDVATLVLTPIKFLENGTFLIIRSNPRTPGGVLATYPGNAFQSNIECQGIYMVYNEKKIYDDRLGYSNFVECASDKVDNILYPRLIKMSPHSDIFTTNCLDDTRDTLYTLGDKLYIQPDGRLGKTSSIFPLPIACQVIKSNKYMMPDGLPSVKVITIPN